MRQLVRGEGRHGWIALIGGGEDKSRDRDVLRRIVEVNQARNVVIIPTASRVSDEVGDEYERSFRAIGVPVRRVLDITRPSEAALPEHLAAVDEADLIFFSGGDQVRLVDILQGTKLMSHVGRRLREGATIAGTSAGAAAAGERMLFDGDRRGFAKGSIGSADGFGFLPGIAIDTHFVSRGRISRLTQFLCSGKVQRGIGLSENTALLISPDDIATVVGTDMVTTLCHRQVSHSDYHDIDEGENFTVDGIRLGFLAPGSRFDLERWTCLPTRPLSPRQTMKSASLPA